MSEAERWTQIVRALRTLTMSPEAPLRRKQFAEGILRILGSTPELIDEADLEWMTDLAESNDEQLRRVAARAAWLLTDKWPDKSSEVMTRVVRRCVSALLRIVRTADDVDVLNQAVDTFLMIAGTPAGVYLDIPNELLRLAHRAECRSRLFSSPHRNMLTNNSQLGLVGIALTPSVLKAVLAVVMVREDVLSLSIPLGTRIRSGRVDLPDSILRGVSEVDSLKSNEKHGLLLFLKACVRCR